MISYDAFIDMLTKSESHFSRLMGRFDPSQTVSLRAMLTGDTSAQHILNASWLDVPRLKATIRRSLDWLSKVQHLQAPRTCELFFFQKNCETEDQSQYLKVIAHDSLYEKYWNTKYCNASMQVRYIHTESNFTRDFLETPWGLRIRPWMGFSTPPEYRDKVGYGMIGYRIPNYENLLQVSPTIATDYLSRIIVHDIGHHYLPNTELHEDMHNVAMIAAMGIGNVRYESDWEECIHRECVDPLYFIDAEKQVRRLLETHPKNPTTTYILNAYLELYTREDKDPLMFNWKKTFSLEDGATRDQTLATARMNIERARQTGFALYSRS